MLRFVFDGRQSVKTFKANMKFGRTTIAFVAAVSLVAAPAFADIQETEQQLRDAEEGLNDVQLRIAAVSDEMERIDVRLAETNAELAVLEDDLEGAERVLAQAEQKQHHAEVRQVNSERNLERAEVRFDDAVEQFHARIVHMYKHGSGQDMEMLMQGLLGAEDWHQVSLTVESYNRTVQKDKELTEELELAALDAEQASHAAVVATAAAEEASGQAEDERAHVANLVNETQVLIVSIEEDLAEREQVLEALADDEEVTLQLVADLENELEHLRYEQFLRDVALQEQQEAERQQAQQAAQQRELSRQGQNRQPNAGIATGNEPVPDWASRLPPGGAQWAPAIERASANAGIDPKLLAAIVWAESSFNPNAISHAGAIGLTQLMPGTAAGLGVDPWNSEQNLNGGARYIRQQLDAFQSIELALAAYNAGPGNVRRVGGIPNFPETQMYVPKVLGYYNHLAGN